MQQQNNNRFAICRFEDQRSKELDKMDPLMVIKQTLDLRKEKDKIKNRHKGVKKNKDRLLMGFKIN